MNDVFLRIKCVPPVYKTATVLHQLEQRRIAAIPNLLEFIYLLYTVYLKGHI